MRDRLYDLMSEFNVIIEDIECLGDAVEVHFDGIVEQYDCEKQKAF